MAKWIDWTGCKIPPVKDNEEFKVQFRHETIGVAEERGWVQEGKFGIWDHFDCSGDIIAYKTRNKKPA
jgi:hypothetical protein